MNVNYMVEIITLDEWELTHPLGATAYKVLRKLYHLANKQRFPERIKVPNTILMSLVGCGESSLMAARNTLIQAGRIGYDGKQKKTPSYMIQYFSLDPMYNHENRGYSRGYDGGIERGYRRGYSGGIKCGTYINKTKGDETCSGGEEDSIATGEKNIRARELFPPRSRELSYAEQGAADSMRNVFQTSPLFRDQYPMYDAMLGSDRFSLDMIYEAIQATEKRNGLYPDPLGNPVAYFMELLRDWEERGLRTSRDIHAAKGDWYER